MSSPRHATPRHPPPPHAHAIPNPLPAYDQSPVYITQPLAGMCYIVHKSLIRRTGALNAALTVTDRARARSSATCQWKELVNAYVCTYIPPSDR